VADAIPRFSEHQYLIYRDIDPWEPIVITSDESSRPGYICKQYRCVHEATKANILGTLQHLEAQHMSLGDVDPLDLFFRFKAAEMIILNQAVHFSTRSFRSIDRTLNSIDRKICTINTTARANDADRWQYLFGAWRSKLPEISQDLSATASLLDASGFRDAEGTVGHKQLMVKCESLLNRNERTSQALMSRLSILESQIAIIQGNEIQKLTELAFVFIPLSFVAAFFGMEVQVCTHYWKKSATHGTIANVPC
jgi:hypothetical protein